MQRAAGGFGHLAHRVGGALQRRNHGRGAAQGERPAGDRGGFARGAAQGIPLEPLAFALDQPFPNPAAAAATVRYQLPAREHVTVEVFDVLGRRVATLFDGVQDGGRHAASWATGGAASGTYVVRLRAGDAAATRLVQVVR